MLTIDSRENSALSIEVEKKAKALNIATKKEFIEVGDYVFSDVCFEAKSVVDFLGSVMSKRLWTQIDNMDRYYQTNVVIIHGDLDEGIQMVKDHVVSKMPEPARSITLRNKFLGAIGRITLDTDAKAFWVPSHREAAAAPVRARNKPASSPSTRIARTSRCQPCLSLGLSARRSSRLATIDKIMSACVSSSASAISARTSSSSGGAIAGIAMPAASASTRARWKMTRHGFS